MESNASLYEQANALRLRADVPVPTNAFKWSKATIEIFYPSAAIEIHRLEAEQKFFRSMVGALLIVCGILLWSVVDPGRSWSPMNTHMPLVSSLRRPEEKEYNLAYTYILAVAVYRNSLGTPSAARNSSGTPSTA